MITAGTVKDISPHSGEWLIVDVGFSSEKQTCGVLGSKGQAVSMTFAETRKHIVDTANKGRGVLNLVIEAPLSVAFNRAGNPIGRSFEREGAQHRYWYAGLGCQVTISALYMLNALVESKPRREVRLFEGFVSFKTRGAGANHCEDVEALARVIRKKRKGKRDVLSGEDMVDSAIGEVTSAFAVAGMDFGVPPVIMVRAQPGTK